MRVNSSIFLIIVLFLSPALLLAQRRGEVLGETHSVITQQAKGRFGSHYEVVALSFDSLIGTVEDIYELGGGEERLDPYKTLRGCIVFSASPFESENEDGEASYCGIFKNGTIIWDSGPVFEGSLQHIFATNDINRDGQVDIVMIWMRGIDDMRNYLWILSWNGSIGRIINDTLQDRGRTIISAVGAFQMFDADGDGIMEFRGSEKTIDPDNPDEMISKPITYSWNGSVYGVFGKRVPETAFLPANRIDVSVTCRVEKAENELMFRYVWRSAPTSKQRVRAIYFPNLPGGILVFSRSSHWEAGPFALISGAYWYLLDVHKAEMIKPGETMSGFGISYNGLPVIVRYHVQGHVPEPTEFRSDEEMLELSRNDILTNSAQGYTIAPKDPPEPFVPLTILDTLISYKHQAFDFGWIKNKGIVQSLNAKLENARTQLQRNNTTTAKNIL